MTIRERIQLVKEIVGVRLFMAVVLIDSILVAAIIYLLFFQA